MDGDLPPLQSSACIEGFGQEQADASLIPGTLAQRRGAGCWPAHASPRYGRPPAILARQWQSGNQLDRSVELLLIGM